MTRIAQIRALALLGHEPIAIAHHTGASVGSVRTTLTKLRGRGEPIRRYASGARGTFLPVLPPPVASRLAREASARGVGESDLIRSLLAILVEDDLFTAILGEA